MSYPKWIGRRLATAALACALAAGVTAPAQAFTGPRLGSRTLHVGSAGHDVMWLQIDLTKLGFPTRVTAQFNRATRIGLVSFQKAYGMPADGVFGPSSYHELLLALNHRVVPGDGASQASSRKQVVPADDSGGAGFVPAPSSAPVQDATLNAQGLAVAPAGAPAVIQEILNAGNQIAFRPYVYGGGHNGWGPQPGYDCSGSVSFALHGGGLLHSPLDSTELESYGAPGPGRWITIWADGGHTFMEVAGLFFDTVNQQRSNNNDRWSTKMDPWESSQSWTVVHPVGW